MADRVPVVRREQCDYVSERNGSRCIRLGRLFSRNVGPRAAGWWCELHQGGSNPEPDPARTARGLSRAAAVAAVTRAVVAAMNAGATGPELLEAYNQAERQHVLSGVGG